MIIPGGTLKGNMYFKGTLGVKENSKELDAAELSDSEEESDQEDDYLKLKT